VSQAGEVAEIITTIDAILARPGLNPTLLLQRCRNIVTAQAAEIASYERAALISVQQINGLAAALAAKDAEISYLLDDYVHWIDAKIARDRDLAGKKTA
jgi:hypothetical protein